MSPENEETPDSAFGRLMDDQRNELGLLWEDVAELSGLSRQTIYDIRKGKTDYRRMRSRTKHRLELALQWKRGSIDEVHANGTPPPRAAPSAARSLEAVEPSSDADLIFEGFRQLFRTHSVRMTPRHLRQFLADVDAELQARANTAGKSITEDDGPFDPQ